MHTKISPEDIDLQSILQQYGITAFTSSPISKGRANVNILVEAKGNKYVLKMFTNTQKSLHDIHEEVKFMMYLHARQIPVPVIHQNQPHTFTIPTDISGTTYYSILMDYIEGTHIEEYTSETVQKIGTMLARFHRVSIEYARQKGLKLPTVMRESSADDISLDSIQNPSTSAFIQRAKEFSITSTNIPSGIVHDDINRSNLLFQNNEICAVLDFDDMKYSHIVQDVGGFIWNLLYSATFNKNDVRLIHDFVQAYEAVRTLSNTEKEVLKDFVLLRNYSFGVFDLQADGEQSESVREDMILEEKIQGWELSVS